jgi:hypothetical protein
MTIMNTELYRALLDAGASEEAASKAAESVASYDKQLAAMDTKLERMDGRLNTLTWMLGTHLALTTLLSGGIIWKLMDLSEKTGRLAEAVSRITT